MLSITAVNFTKTDIYPVECRRIDFLNLMSSSAKIYQRRYHGIQTPLYRDLDLERAATRELAQIMLQKGGRI